MILCIFNYDGFVHIKDEAGKIRIRIDPPDKVTQYPHVHVYDSGLKIFETEPCEYFLRKIKRYATK